jgi:hypothetical protein
VLTVCDHGYLPQPLISVDTTSRLRVPVGLPHDNYPGGPISGIVPPAGLREPDLRPLGKTQEFRCRPCLYDAPRLDGISTGSNESAQSP